MVPASTNSRVVVCLLEYLIEANIYIINAIYYNIKFQQKTDGLGARIGNAGISLVDGRVVFGGESSALSIICC